MASSTATNLVNPDQIEQLIAIRETFQALKKRLETLEGTMSGLEAGIIAQLEAGADCGIYELHIRETARRYPAWKEFFIERVGKTEADAVLAETPATVHKKLVIG